MDYEKIVLAALVAVCISSAGDDDAMARADVNELLSHALDDAEDGVRRLVVTTLKATLTAQNAMARATAADALFDLAVRS